MAQNAKQLSNTVDSLLAEYLGDHKDDLIDIKRGLTSIIGDSKDSAEKVFHEIDGYVSENPWKAIGIASVIGLYVGLVFAKK